MIAKRGDVYMQDVDRWEGLASEFRVRMMERKGGWMRTERGTGVTQMGKLGLKGWPNGMVFGRREGDEDPRQVDDAGGVIRKTGEKYKKHDNWGEERTMEKTRDSEGGRWNESGERG